MTVKPEKLLIGAHTSAAGGVHNALLEGKAIGATTIQLFTSNQKQWKGRKFTPEDIAIWNETLQSTGLREIMCHDSYLINLGSPNSEGLEKSRKAFAEEAERCVALGLSFLNFHPGAALKEDPQQCLDRICESLIQVEKIVSGTNTTLLLETTAGQGSAVGCKFEEIGYIINKVKGKVPVGVCIDTCHIFVAGYDIRDKKGWNQTLETFDRLIGLKYLRAFHLNDSAKGLASRVDRHKPLGEGEIGMDCFKFLMQDPRTREIPKYLETPDGPPLWEKEIKMLREFASHAYKN
jgi:deoxyribonuclease-4